MKTPQGFLFSGIKAGIKKSNKPDLGLIYSEGLLDGAFFFTKNKVKAAPVFSDIEKIKLNKGKINAVLINSGNANCFTGPQGKKDVNSLCEKLSAVSGKKQKYILNASTGIIGKRLPVKKITGNIDKLWSGLAKNINPFADSLLTTDKVRKVSSASFSCGGSKINITGAAKGSGMIHPELCKATMLCFVMTDAAISKQLLKQASAEALEDSFHRITIDQCTSTNDSVFFLTSQKAGNKKITSKGKDYKIFSAQLKKVCIDLAKKLVSDAEGATKFIEVRIKGAKTKSEAKKSAFSIANSLLFKTAMYGKNKNWGRIYQALGQAGINVTENVSVKSSFLKNKNILIKVDLRRGKFQDSVYTSDLSPEYVKINAEYN